MHTCQVAVHPFLVATCSVELLLCPSYSRVFCAQEPPFSRLCGELYEGFVCIYFIRLWPLVWLCTSECNSGQICRGAVSVCGEGRVMFWASVLPVDVHVEHFWARDVDSAHWYLSGHEHVWPLLAFDGGMPCGREESTRWVALFISLPLRLGRHCLACGADNPRNCWPPVIDIACVCIFFCFAASVLCLAFFFFLS